MVDLPTPIIACRPRRIEDLDPARLALWQAIRAAGMPEPFIYPDSIPMVCEDCGVEVVVGPRQQDALEFATSMGQEVAVVCLVDAARLAAEAESSSVKNLGNPYKES